MRLLRKFLVSLVTTLIVYLCICFTLIFWPIEGRKDIKNYDYSSLAESTKDSGLGEEHWIELRDGEKLLSRVYPSTTDTTLLLLHGSGSESRYLSQLSSYLSSAGVSRVLTPDLRGHGRNPHPRGDVDYIGQLDHDVEDLIQHIRKIYPGTRVILGGHSSGGGMALRYGGNKDVTQPDALLLIAPYLGHEAPTVKPNSGEWVTVALKRWIGLSMLNNLGIKMFNDKPVLIFNRPDSVADEWQVDSYSYRMAVNFAPNDYIQDIENIAMPTLVLVGENDESFHPEKFEEVFRSAKKHADTYIIGKANHMDIVDVNDSLNHIVKWYGSVQQEVAGNAH